VKWVGASTYTYDLDSGTLTANHTGPGDGATSLTTLTYNPDNELAQQVSNVSGTTSFTYDNTGSQLTATGPIHTRLSTAIRHVCSHGEARRHGIRHSRRHFSPAPST
jgi:hypothetical protein